jgi:hypothetical protein
MNVVILGLVKIDQFDDNNWNDNINGDHIKRPSLYAIILYFLGVGGGGGARGRGDK